MKSGSKRMIIVGYVDSSLITGFVSFVTEADTVICFDVETANSMKGFGIKCSLLDDLKIDAQKVEEDSFRLMENIAEQKVGISQTIVNCLAYRDTSLWYFIEGGLYELIKEIIAKIMLFEAWFKYVAPQRIELVNLSSYEDLIVQMAETNSIIVDSNRLSRFTAPKSSPHVSGTSNLLRLLVRYFLRGFSYKFFKKRNKDGPKSKILLLSYDADWRILFDPSKSIHVAYNLFMSPLSKALSQYEDIDIILLDEDTHPLKEPMKSLNSLISRIKAANAVPWESHMDWNAFNKTRTEHVRIKKIIINALNASVWNLKVNNVRIDGPVRDWILAYAEKDLFFMIALIETCYKILRKEVDAVVLVNEYGGMGLSLAIAARNLGIPIVSLQHGIISKYHPGYHKNIRRIISSQKSAFPLSDKLLLHGEYFKRTLMELGYPEDMLTVVGDPRHDILYELLRTVDRKSVLTSLGLDPAKKTIFYATQPFKSEYKKFVINLIVEALKNLPDVQLIVKIHPAESDDVTYRLLERELNNSRVKILTHKSTYEFLISCDLLLTVTSSTIIEAMACRKPTILIDIPREQEAVSFFTSTLIHVSNASALLNSIKEVLSDDTNYDLVLQNQSTLLKDILYLADGKASERVAKEIMKIIHIKKGIEN